MFSLTNKMPDISPAKTGLFGISRELPFGVCNHGEPRVSPHTARDGEHFYRGEGKLGGDSKQRVGGLSLAESWPGRKRSLSSSYWALPSLQGMSAPPAGLSALFK